MNYDDFKLSSPPESTSFFEDEINGKIRNLKEWKHTESEPRKKATDRLVSYLNTLINN